MRDLRKMNEEVDNITNILISVIVGVLIIILLILALHFLINMLCVVFLHG